MVFFVYIDRTLETLSRVFYVGKGNESRIRERKRNLYWQRVAAKYGHEREVVFATKDERAALDFEIELIAVYKTYRFDNADRWGCNFTRGGDGTSGYKHTPEYIASQSGPGNPFYGKTHSPEFLQRMSEERSGERSWLYGKRGAASHNYGRKDTPQQITFKRELIRGEKNINAKLTQEKVDLIRSMYATNEYTQKELGMMFEVCRSTIFKVLHYERWAVDV